MSDASDTVLDEHDPRRWFVLTVTLVATIIVVLDNTIVNVAIPTILKEFDTTLPALQWVITGYALTFATFLIIGGRLGDIYGHRRVFIWGAALFAGGSLLASLSWNVPSLVVGEALIEGLGASLMLPTALAILSTTFSGEQRARAFALWGAVIGSAAGLGPLLGGWLTTDYSWRWSFRINVVIAPLSILGALAFVPKKEQRGRRDPLDLPGAAMVAVGMFLLVFALSEGGTYGWIEPLQAVTILGTTLWPATASVSIIPFVLVVALAVLFGFFRYERAKERAERHPLFEFGLLQRRTFRYGLLTSVVVSMAQLGMILSFSLFLQDAVQLTALQNGVWMLPMGISILIGAPVGGRLVKRIGPPRVVQTGLVVQAVGMLYLIVRLDPDLSFLALLPGLAGYGLGSGMATSQLTNVVLSDVPAEKSGVASGSNSTVRQVGSALGIAIIGSLITSQTVSHAVSRIRSSRMVPAELRERALAGVRATGTSYRAPKAFPAGPRAELDRITTSAVASGVRGAMGFAFVVVLVGAFMAFLLHRNTATDPDLADELASLGPLDPESEVHPTPAAGH